jgi:hypothetical protein
MFRKRMAAIAKRAKDELDRQREQQRADSERLIGVLGDVLAGVREALGLSEAERSEGTPDPIDKVQERTGRAVLQAWRPAEGWSSCPPITRRSRRITATTTLR